MSYKYSPIPEPSSSSHPRSKSSASAFTLDSEDEEENLKTSVNTKHIPHIPSLHNTKLSPTRLDHEFYARDSILSPSALSVENLPSFQPVRVLSSSEFLHVVDSVKDAISSGIFPTRISQGSSGSYFCKDKSGKIVGVFKPKNEEPYGHLNPKWTKWIHKNLFPCCFGRSCLIPNLGYVSEAAASFVDRKLGLSICPRTEIVSLSSPTFFYSAKDRYKYGSGEPLPEKLGSFQLFLDGFKDATTFFKEGYDRIKSQERTSNASQILWSYLGAGSYASLFSDEEWDDKSRDEFRWGFERLVVLDYLIRNTDRGTDNWMVRYDSPTILPKSTPSIEFVDAPSEPTEQVVIDLADAILAPTTSTSNKSTELNVRVAAIDNGLAFPYKHPDSWRSYPYGWAHLPCARVPFSKETVAALLHLLTSQEWWNELFIGLERLFRLDPDFNLSMFRKQKAVMRGQGYNLVEVLRRSEAGDSLRGSPWALLQRPPVCVFDEDEGFVERSKRRLQQARQRFEAFTRNQPCFSWC